MKISYSKLKWQQWLFVVGILVIIVLLGYYGLFERKEPVSYTDASKLPSHSYSLQADEEVLKKYIAPVPDQLIIINRTSNELALFENGQLIRTFTVATGKGSTPTPTGMFPVVNKLKNRPYYKLSIPGGDPRNPLGDRWIGLDIEGTEGTTYAIHGNNNTASIGRHVSNGCVRMYNDEIRELFERVQIGTMVIIKDFNGPWGTVAMEYGYKIYS